MFSFQFQDIDFAHKLDRASSPKDEYLKHMHPFIELLYFVSGKVTYNVEGLTQELKPGTMIFVAPGKFHFATVNKGVNYERYVLKFPSSLLPDYLYQELKEADVYSHPQLYPDNFFDRLDYDASLTRLNNVEKRELFLCDLIRFLLLKSKDMNKRVDEKETLVQKIIFYIDHHLEENLSLHSLSSSLHYSESYLTVLFKESMHCPIMQYIRSKKVMLAYQKIQNGAKPHAVAEELGFNDYSTFYRAYKSLLGFSPNQKEGVLTKLS